MNRGTRSRLDLGAGRRGARASILFALIAGLAACASPPPAPEPCQDVRLSLGDLACEAVGLGRFRISGTLAVSNEGELEAEVLELTYRCDAGAAAELPLLAGLVPERVELRLGPGESASLALAFEAKLPGGSEPLVPVELGAELRYQGPDGSSRVASTSASLEVPRVLPPELTVRRILILRDELINTRLRVDLEIRNPNAFPLAFSSLEYRLHGEGRYWASGSLGERFTTPALSTATASLYLTMNFTDMSRSLLDQVIKLASVSYRLEGKGRIATGLAFLPEFALPFDLAGTVSVTR